MRSPAGPDFDDHFLHVLERLALAGKAQAQRRRGALLHRRMGTGFDLADRRDYSPGDDLRRLDWNLFGRLGRLLVRVYDEPEPLPLHILCDASRSMSVGRVPKLNLALEITAALAFLGLSAGHRVSVSVGSAALVPGVGPLRGKQRIHEVLRFLREIESSGGTDLGAQADGLSRIQKGRTRVVWISDFLDPKGYEPATDRLRRAQFMPSLIRIVAPEEAVAPPDAEVVLVDAETGTERYVRLSPALRAHYAGWQLERNQAFADSCKRRGILGATFLSDIGFEAAIRKLMRLQGGPT